MESQIDSLYFSATEFAKKTGNDPNFFPLKVNSTALPTKPKTKQKRPNHRNYLGKTS